MVYICKNQRFALANLLNQRSKMACNIISKTKTKPQKDEIWFILIQM